MSDKLTYEVVQSYLTQLVPPRHPEMYEMEAYARETGFPIIGPAAGYLCYQIARMVKAKHIFEMGSGYGYSTAWFAKAVMENGGGRVHHVVWESDLSQRARRHLGNLGYNDIVQYHVGEAVHTLDESSGNYDLVFNDIDKPAYATSLNVITKKLRPGGVLIVDNVLWYGNIFDNNDNSDSTEAIRELTILLKEDPGWITTLAPVRDGLIVAYRT
jgi:predicted O-methyltransferase YrrM